MKKNVSTSFPACSHAFLPVLPCQQITDTVWPWIGGKPDDFLKGFQGTLWLHLHHTTVKLNVVGFNNTDLLYMKNHTTLVSPFEIVLEQSVVEQDR